MRKVHFILCILHFAFYINAQNLVLNPGFETYSACPSGGSQLTLASPWLSPSSQTPDYFNSCAFAFTTVNVPYNFVGYQYAHSGVAYAGGHAYGGKGSTNSREYVQGKLSDSLIAKKKYCVTFYVNLANKSQYAINSLGAYLSKDSIRNTFGVLPYASQISNPATRLLNDTSNWIAITGVFIAAGGEKYITIGNFNTDINTDTISIQKFLLNKVDNIAYYYIDDVSVIPYLEAQAGISEDTTICLGANLILGTPATTGISYNWQPVTGLNNSTIAQPLANLTVTTTYVLTIGDTSTNYCIPKTTDTITVHVNNCDTTSYIQLPLPNVFTPNSDDINDVFKITCTNMKEIKCEIYNRWGVQVFYKLLSDNLQPTSNINWEGATNAGLECTEGVYYYVFAAQGNDGKDYHQNGFVQLLR
jgi:gliding motility-associated-like protein